MKNKYKINDSVKCIRSGHERENCIGEIIGIDNTHIPYYVVFKGYEYWLREEDLILVINDKSISETADKIIEKSTARRITKPLIDLLEECYDILGMPFNKAEFESNIKETEEQHNEMEQILVNEDRILRKKAESYDKICAKMFMASGVIEDGDSFKWLIDPDIICSVILKIILDDVNVDRDKIIEDKKVKYSKIFKDG